jgi:hypothetical protein
LWECFPEDKDVYLPTVCVLERREMWQRRGGSCPENKNACSILLDVARPDYPFAVRTRFIIENQASAGGCGRFPLTVAFGVGWFGIPTSGRTSSPE